jgi:hypothetical protein
MATLSLTAVVVFALGAEEPGSAIQKGAAGFELLSNGGFEAPGLPGTPVGWYRAMIPAKAVNFEAGVEDVSGRGKVAFIKQDGVLTSLCNNWAQRLDTIPAGARLRLSAEVKTENVPADTGFVVVQCWDRQEKLVAVGTSQSVEPIGGTQDWRPVSFELTVPETTDTIIVRCGLTQSGRICFDDVSLVIVSPAKLPPAGKMPFRGQGFEVTAESLQELETVTSFSEELVAYGRQRLGPGPVVRKEVFAQGGGRYQVVLSLDLSTRSQDR